MAELKLPREYSKQEETISFLLESSSGKMRIELVARQDSLSPVWPGVREMARIQTARPLSEEIANTFKDLVSKIEGVIEVHFKARGDSFDVWTVIDRDDTALMRKVYKAELELMDKFPDPEFDFRVIPKDIFFPPGTFTRIL